MLVCRAKTRKIMKAEVKFVALHWTFKVVELQL